MGYVCCARVVCVLFEREKSNRFDCLNDDAIGRSSRNARSFFYGLRNCCGSRNKKRLRFVNVCDWMRVFFREGEKIVGSGGHSLLRCNQT